VRGNWFVNSGVHALSSIEDLRIERVRVRCSEIDGCNIVCWVMMN
jgi:hypothetical protein